MEEAGGGGEEEHSSTIDSRLPFLSRCRCCSLSLPPAVKGAMSKVIAKVARLVHCEPVCLVAAVGSRVSVCVFVHSPTSLSLLRSFALLLLLRWLSVIRSTAHCMLQAPTTTTTTRARHTKKREEQANSNGLYTDNDWRPSKHTHCKST